MTPPRNSTAARDVAYALHPYTDHKAHLEKGPVVISRGEGVRVWDDQGKEYIESVAGLWCAALGFSNERLVEAAAAQMRRLPFYHAFTAKSHEPMVGWCLSLEFPKWEIGLCQRVVLWKTGLGFQTETPQMVDLAEMLIERAPAPMSKVFFANSGSEANDSVIKILWYMNNAIGKPEKKKIIGRLKGYHGITLAAASVTGLPNNHKLFDLPLPGFFHVSAPHHYRGARPGESEEDFATRLAQELEDLILREGPETVAAFFAEPVMGAGGVIVPPATYYEKVQAVLKCHDVLFVADEVICGFWRTGEYWGSQTMGIRPDIVTCAKALSSSFLPISAVMVNERVFQGIAEGSSTVGTWGHGFTYSGHPVPAAVAIETLKIYDDMEIGAHVGRVGPHLQRRLRERFADHPLVGEVRGIGIVAAVELVADPETRANFDPGRKVGARLTKLGEDHGVILRSLPGDSIAFSPPLVITEGEVDEMLDRFGRALDELAVQLRREGLAAV